MSVTQLANDFHAWSYANDDTTDEGPILEVSAGVHSIVGTTQIRSGFAEKYLIRAAAGAEYQGILTDPSTIATIDFQGGELYFRKPNITFENVYVKHYDHKVTSDDYSNVVFKNCALDAQQFLANPCLGGANYENCHIIIESTNTEDSTVAQAIYLQGSVSASLLSCTIINESGVANGAFGTVHTSSDRPLSINQTVVFATNVVAFGNTGTGTISGDYNAGHDATLPGDNSPIDTR